MNIQDLKNSIGLPSLELERCLDEQDQPTQWLRHWDNENRIAVVMHEEVAQGIKQDPMRTDLVMKKADVASKTSGELYTSIIVAIKKNVEFAF